MCRSRFQRPQPSRLTQTGSGLAEAALAEERRLQEEAEAAERERQRKIEEEKARIRAEEEKERRIVEVGLPQPCEMHRNRCAMPLRGISFIPIRVIRLCLCVRCSGSSPSWGGVVG